MSAKTTSIICEHATGDGGVQKKMVVFSRNLWCSVEDSGVSLKKVMFKRRWCCSVEDVGVLLVGDGSVQVEHGGVQYKMMVILSRRW